MELRVFLVVQFAVLALCVDKALGQTGRATNCVKVPYEKSCFGQTDVKLFLYTRSNPTTGQLIDISANNLAATHFNRDHPTKLAVHGFMTPVAPDIGPYNADLRDAYFIRGDYNMIVVKYASLAQGPYECYPSAVKNARYVGKCIAHTVARLRDRGIEDIHFIGGSLGAQVLGFMADHLRPYRVKRISGIDPAFPFFNSPVRNSLLDSSDAVFVDIFHTNGFIQGSPYASGHVDFYFNGGTNQPGCGHWIINITLCSHIRASEFYIESVNSKAGFWGTPCSSHLDMLKGRCPVVSPTILAGEDVDIRSRGVVVLTTNPKPPFAMGK